MKKKKEFACIHLLQIAYKILNTPLLISPLLPVAFELVSVYKLLCSAIFNICPYYYCKNYVKY